jgi:hypothetical protein
MKRDFEGAKRVLFGGLNLKEIFNPELSRFGI